MASFARRFSVVKAEPPAGCKDGECNPLRFVLKEARERDTGLFTVLVYAQGRDPMGWIYINITNSPEEKAQGPPVEKTSEEPHITYMNDVTYQEKIRIETGYREENLWLHWMQYSAKQITPGDCVVCAEARPAQTPVPARISNITCRPGVPKDPLPTPSGDETDTAPIFLNNQ
ncbi:hypothetical protein NHX12_020486 [Muraenolepis orangiensis]|uniref:Uncharacterized protein n=1 Tax=Muraenolepis orangiensis TaxID=630683 RepID=A0A9Q0ERP8_9TELE|nr:hypothetical protein NHX12_020486 [Muraenolepis orangiensis]